MRLSWKAVIALVLVCVLVGSYVASDIYPQHVERIMYNGGYHAQCFGVWQVSHFGHTFGYTCTRCHAHFTSSRDFRK